jgi:hypothetical protein
MDPLENTATQQTLDIFCEQTQKGTLTIEVIDTGVGIGKVL